MDANLKINLFLDNKGNLDILLLYQARLTIEQIWIILFRHVDSPTLVDSIIEEKQIGRLASRLVRS